jgi:hypothetical protein
MFFEGIASTRKSTQSERPATFRERLTDGAQDDPPPGEHRFLALLAIEQRSSHEPSLK